MDFAQDIQMRFAAHRTRTVLLDRWTLVLRSCEPQLQELAQSVVTESLAKDGTDDPDGVLRDSLVTWLWHTYTTGLETTLRLVAATEVEVVTGLQQMIAAERQRLEDEAAATTAALTDTHAELRDLHDPAHVLLPDPPTTSTYEQ